jgi:hypothetical protein
MFCTLTDRLDVDWIFQLHGRYRNDVEDAQEAKSLWADHELTQDDMEADLKSRRSFQDIFLPPAMPFAPIAWLG